MDPQPQLAKESISFVCATVSRNWTSRNYKNSYKKKRKQPQRLPRVHLMTLFLVFFIVLRSMSTQTRLLKKMKRKWMCNMDETRRLDWAGNLIQRRRKGYKGDRVSTRRRDRGGLHGLCIKVFLEDKFCSTLLNKCFSNWTTWTRETWLIIFLVVLVYLHVFWDW